MVAAQRQRPDIKPELLQAIVQYLKDTGKPWYAYAGLGKENMWYVFPDGELYPTRQRRGPEAPLAKLKEKEHGLLATHTKS